MRPTFSGGCGYWTGGCGHWTGGCGYWNGGCGYWTGGCGYWNGGRGYWTGGRGYWNGGCGYGNGGCGYGTGGCGYGNGGRGHGNGGNSVRKIPMGFSSEHDAYASVPLWCLLTLDALMGLNNGFLCNSKRLRPTDRPAMRFKQTSLFGKPWLVFTSGTRADFSLTGK